MKQSLLVAAMMVATVATSSAAMASQPYELPNVMSITKSSNRNEVHYAASVDDRCVPVTQAPLRAMVPVPR